MNARPGVRGVRGLLGVRGLRGLRIAALALVAAALGSGSATAKLVGGKAEHRQATDPATEIARLARSSSTVWLAWTVQARGNDAICGFGRHHASGQGAWGLRLDDDDSSWGSRDDAPPIATTTVEIYAAVRDGRVRRLRFASERCPVTAGNSAVVWLDGVTPEASVALLAGIAQRAGRADQAATKPDEGLFEGALVGLAFHASPAAPLALVHLGREGETEELRSQSLFWLAQTGAPDSGRWIREAIARDPASEVREQGVFALSQLPDGTPQLLALLHDSRDREVKRQALFWLGQSDDPRAAAELERLLTR